MKNQLKIERGLCWCAVLHVFICSYFINLSYGYKGNKVLECGARREESHVDEQQGWPTTHESTQVIDIIKARSLVECGVICKRNRKCIRSQYEPEQGVCQLLKEGSNVVQLITGHESERSLLMDFSPATFNQPSRSCSDLSCATNAVCATDCSYSRSSPEPICLAIEEDNCHEFPILNIQYYHMDNFTVESMFENNTIKIMENSFKKYHDWSGLRVRWRSSLRGGSGCTDCCTRFYFTFNGIECNSPDTIEYQHYTAVDKDNRRSDGIDGICEQIPSGNVQIELHADVCPGFNHSFSFSVGSVNRVGRLYVEETDTRHNLGNPLCLALSVFNVYQHVVRQEVAGGAGTRIMSFMYHKRAPDTALKLMWYGSIRLTGESAPKCAEWYFTFNESKCTDPGDVFGLLYHVTNQIYYAPDERRSALFEGICNNLPAGNVSIAVNVGNCYGHAETIDTLTGWNTPSRVIVEEIRLGHKFSAYRVHDDDLRRIPLFNIQSANWIIHHSRGEDQLQGIYKTTYTKVSDYSILRLILSGDLRSWALTAAYSPCCRYYFSINGEECTQPGPIDGIIWTSHHHNYHRPAIIDGICKGIQSGSYNIWLNVGKCPGETKVGDCWSGFYALMHIRMEELSLGIN